MRELGSPTVPRADVLAAAGLFAFAVLGASPSVGWLDSGSLVASAWTMGVAHPPGEPAWLAVAKLAQLLPVGDIAFRTTLVSAACVAACVFPLAALCRGRDGGAAPAGSTALVAAVLIGFGARLQAVRAEVYGPTLLLLCTALWASLRLRGPRASALIGLTLGVGAAVHPLLCLVAVPALLIGRLSTGPARARDAAVAGLAGLWGFAAYLWLPLRARAIPARAWGVPDSWDRFVDVLLARTFSRNFGGDGGSGLVENLEVVFSVWAKAGLPVLVAVGLLACFRWRGGAVPAVHGARVLALVALAWLAGNAWTIVPQNKVIPTNPDLLGYLAVGVVVAVPFAAAGLPRLGRYAPLVAIALLTWQSVDGVLASRTANHRARTFATAQAVGLPPGSILIPSGNDTAFVWTYLQSVERRRADLVVLPRVLMGHRHELVRLGGLDRLERLGIPWRPELQESPVVVLARSAMRPLFIEIREPEQELVAAGRIRRHGVVGTVGAGPAESDLLQIVRANVLWELEARGLSRDTQSDDVRAYFRYLWEPAR